MYHLLSPNQRPVRADEDRRVKAAARLAQIEVRRGHDALGAAGVLKMPDDGAFQCEELVRGVAPFVLREEQVQLQLGVDDQVGSRGRGAVQGVEPALQIGLFVRAHAHLAEGEFHGSTSFLRLRFFGSGVTGRSSAMAARVSSASSMSRIQCSLAPP